MVQLLNWWVSEGLGAGLEGGRGCHGASEEEVLSRGRCCRGANDRPSMMWWPTALLTGFWRERNSVRQI